MAEKKTEVDTNLSVNEDPVGIQPSPTKSNGSGPPATKPKQKTVSIPTLPDVVTAPKPVVKEVVKQNNTDKTEHAAPIEDSATKTPVENPVKKVDARKTDSTVLATATTQFQASTSPAHKVLINTPQLGSLFDLKSTIEKAEQAARENSLKLNEENAVAWWHDFRQTISSPSVAVAFKEAVVTLEEKVMKIVVDSPLAKTRINEENDLLIRFRNAFHDHSLELAIIVEESEASLEAKKPKKILTVREKYERLVAKNPAMDDLKNKLGLIVDHDE
jgi:hypothetical protein